MLDGLANVTALDSRHEDDLAGRLDDVDAIIVYHATIAAKRCSSTASGKRSRAAGSVWNSTRMEAQTPCSASTRLRS